jgi:hypothetical protein
VTTALSRTYWRAALFVPVLGGIVGYVLPPGEFAAFLSVGSIMVAIPYLPFAVLMWWLVGRTSSLAGVIGLALTAPIIFLPFFAVFFEFQGVAGRSWSDWLSMLRPFAPLLLVTAYGYVMLCLIGFFVVKLAVVKGSAKDDSRAVE